MESWVALVVSGIVSVLVASITAAITASLRTKHEIQKETAKTELAIRNMQKYEFIQPLKFIAHEFAGRLEHICSSLENEDSDAQKRMVQRLIQKVDLQPHEWYYQGDDISQGGYFITSTIYKNCVLFYWIKHILFKHPYILLDISTVPLTVWNNYERYIGKNRKKSSSFKNDTCDIFDIIQNIRIQLGVKKGIPYGLHDSIGDFLDIEGKLINYEEFCMQLMDENKAVKFLPVINFWTSIVDEAGIVDKDRLNKVRSLLTILDILEGAKFIKT